MSGAGLVYEGGRGVNVVRQPQLRGAAEVHRHAAGPGRGKAQALPLSPVRAQGDDVRSGVDGRQAHHGEPAAGACGVPAVVPRDMTPHLYHVTGRRRCGRHLIVCAASTQEELAAAIAGAGIREVYHISELGPISGPAAYPTGKQLAPARCPHSQGAPAGDDPTQRLLYPAGRGVQHNTGPVVARSAAAGPNK